MAETVLAALGISAAELERRGLCRCDEATDLVVVQTDPDGREHLLTPAAAESWRRMAADAEAAGVPLVILSAYRSSERQAELIRRKLASGLSIDDILRVSAPPGYSEHHTGLAVDVGIAGDETLEQSFECTPAFSWLKKNAGAYGFRLSYPEGNREGYAYEPWHWYFSGPRASSA